MRSPSDDLTAKARIRDAAIAAIARDKDASLRTIAGDAGVSAPLIVKHYGSRDGLLEACDQHVLRVIREAKAASVGRGELRPMHEEFAEIEQYGPPMWYLIARLNAGSALMGHLIDDMTRDAVQYMRLGVENGLIKASADEEARARYLVVAGWGYLMLSYNIARTTHPDPDSLTVMDVYGDAFGPLLEIYSQGVLTDKFMAGIAPPDVATDPPPDDAPTPDPTTS